MGVFKPTPWAIITWRRGAAARKRERAVAELCRIYWRPLFCVIRERGFAPCDAEDLTQGFLLHFIQSKAAARAHPGKGRFRDFLVGALEHYLIDSQARAQTLKRGGGVLKVALDDASIAEVDSLIARTPNGNVDPECDREGFASLLGKVLDQLESQYVHCGRGLLFRLLKPYLAGDGDAPQPYWNLALRLHRSPVTLRSDVKRIRAQFRELLREELRSRVGASRMDEELENLRAVLRKS